MTELRASAAGASATYLWQIDGFRYDVGEEGTPVDGLGAGAPRGLAVGRPGHQGSGVNPFQLCHSTSQPISLAPQKSGQLGSKPRTAREL
jgi:hypothetical protein